MTAEQLKRREALRAAGAPLAPGFGKAIRQAMTSARAAQDHMEQSGTNRAIIAAIALKPVAPGLAEVVRLRRIEAAYRGQQAEDIARFRRLLQE